MASESISGLNISKAEPVDIRQLVADSTERLALKYPYYGMLVTQKDNGKTYKYITATPVDGSLPSNTAADWERHIKFYTGSGVPSNSVGTDDDIYIKEDGSAIYKKIAAVWSSLFTFNGADILFGAGAPAGGLGNIGDTYIATDTQNVYSKTGVSTWTLETNIKGANGTSDKYATTSTTSINFGTVTAPLNITVGLNLSYTVGQQVTVASRSTPTRILTGTVTSYIPGTGAMVLNPITPSGTGSATDLDVNLSGTPGQQGIGFKHIEHDITLTDAKITLVEGGSYTKQNPWSASILNDSRSSFSSPALLAGSMAGHSIVWDGTAWTDNGRWLGFTGATGATGGIGPQGPTGPQGPSGLIPVVSTTTTNGSTVNFTSTNLLRQIYSVTDVGGAIVTINLGNSPLGTEVHFAPQGSSRFIVNGSIYYKGLALTQIIVDTRTDATSKVRKLMLISLGGGSYYAISEINDQSISISGPAYLDVQENSHTGNIAVNTTYTFGPFTYVPTIDASNTLLILVSVWLWCRENDHNVNLNLDYNIGGAGWVNLLSKTVKLRTGGINAGVYVQNTIHTTFTAPLGNTDNIQFRLVVSSPDGSNIIARGSSNGDWTILALPKSIS